jgi:hypothetical protein
VALGGIVALLLGLSGWLIGSQIVSSPATKHAPKPAPSTPSDLVQFRDPAGAFAGAYPSTWRRLAASDAEVVLLAASNDGASFLARKTPIRGPVGLANLATARNLADRVVKSGKNVVMLHQPQQVTLGGLPGFLYLYTFDDPSTGQRGGHAHYFLFQGATMITLVFQALPATTMVSKAPLFDRIAAAFRALPR